MDNSIRQRWLNSFQKTQSLVLSNSKEVQPQTLSSSSLFSVRISKFLLTKKNESVSYSVSFFDVRTKAFYGSTESLSTNVPRRNNLSNAIQFYWNQTCSNPTPVLVFEFRIKGDNQQGLVGWSLLEIQRPGVFTCPLFEGAKRNLLYLRHGNSLDSIQNELHAVEKSIVQFTVQVSETVGPPPVPEKLVGNFSSIIASHMHRTNLLLSSEVTVGGKYNMTDLEESFLDNLYSEGRTTRRKSFLKRKMCKEKNKRSKYEVAKELIYIVHNSYSPLLFERRKMSSQGNGSLVDQTVVSVPTGYENIAILIGLVLTVNSSRKEAKSNDGSYLICFALVFPNLNNEISTEMLLAHFMPSSLRTLLASIDPAIKIYTEEYLNEFSLNLNLVHNGDICSNEIGASTLSHDTREILQHDPFPEDMNAHNHNQDVLINEKVSVNEEEHNIHLPNNSTGCVIALELTTTLEDEVVVFFQFYNLPERTLQLIHSSTETLTLDFSNEKERLHFVQYLEKNILTLNLFYRESNILLGQATFTISDCLKSPKSIVVDMLNIEYQGRLEEIRVKMSVEPTFKKSFDCPNVHETNSVALSSDFTNPIELQPLADVSNEFQLLLEEMRENKHSDDEVDELRLADVYRKKNIIHVLEKRIEKVQVYQSEVAVTQGLMKAIQIVFPVDIGESEIILEHKRVVPIYFGSSSDALILCPRACDAHDDAKFLILHESQDGIFTSTTLANTSTIAIAFSVQAWTLGLEELAFDARFVGSHKLYRFETQLKVSPFPLDREYFCFDKKWSKSFPESEMTKYSYWKISTSGNAEVNVLTDKDSVQVNTSSTGVKVVLFGLSRDNKIVSCWKIHFVE
ncbi:predicted protein [Chaetoceros tenuissimus]|uniref:Uncharacterized protein n=1 Tax=Chaetoceros tenuissimus TaxID=426638 RepID=A0AAD3DCH2_9STRA|nr:predicted protein [Chaetoceros tenuissimus]